MFLRSLSALVLALAAFIASAADGPFAHVSDGVTPPYLRYDGGHLVEGGCPDGSRCALRTATTPLGPHDTQSSSFLLHTGAHLGTGHFAFGARGSATDMACAPNQAIRAFPFLGRGIIIYPQLGRLKFENYTQNCASGNGVVESAYRPIALQLNMTYLVTLWADHRDIGYRIDEQRFDVRTGTWKFVMISQAGCQAIASSADLHRCRRRPEDLSDSHRAFIVNTQDTLWSVSNWYLDAIPAN